MRIGKKLKSVRLMNNESVKTISNLLNMSEGNYTKIERDEIEISLDNTEKLAKHFNIKVDELLNGETLYVTVTNNDEGKSWSGVNQYFTDDKTNADKQHLDSLKKQFNS